MLVHAIVLALGASAPLASGKTVTASARATDTSSMNSTQETDTGKASASAATSVSTSPSPTDVCELKPGVVGRCKAAFRRWTYDPESGGCKRFIYGGCGGNRNNFKTEEECEKACEMAPAPAPDGDICELDIVPGPCKALIPSWGFDGDHCVEFNYGGCGGNGNRFKTEEECEEACEMPPAPAPAPDVDVCELDIVIGPCEAAIRSWGFDGDHCVEFFYGGCEGNENRFDTEEECEKACEMPPAPAPEPDVCELEIVVGPCEALIPSWGFDGDHCVEFNYGGCEGNDNRFKTEEECEKACEMMPAPAPAPTPAPAPAPTPDVCELDIVTGPCRASIPSWGFDGDECVQFVYGGCQGNGNRFDTKKECEAACPPVGTCQLPLETGMCRAAFMRWGFDGTRCVEFTWGGCGGNGNRFDTQEECESACREDICALPTFPPDLLVRCLAIIPAWTFQDGECTAFTYGGCGATANLFFSEEECLELCGPDAGEGPKEEPKMDDEEPAPKRKFSKD